MGSVTGRGLAEGEAIGPALFTPPISFLGDIDIRSGCIVGALEGVHGKSLQGVVLITPSTRGSNGSWRFLYQLYKFGRHPAAIVTDATPDPSLVQGAILAGVPVVCSLDRPLREFAQDGMILRVVSTDGKGVITRGSEGGEAK
jgi:uncharacterized protein